MSAEIERRLMEWAEYRTQLSDVIGFSSTNPIARMMEYGPDGSTGHTSTGGPIPALVDRFRSKLALLLRVREIERLLGEMPGEYVRVVEIEFVDGKGRPAAVRITGWSHATWVKKRSEMIGWLRGKVV